MLTLTKAQIKPRLLEYLRLVEETGEEIIVTDHGRPAVRLVPIRPTDALTTVQAAWSRRVAEGGVRYDASEGVSPLPAEAWGDLA